MTHITRDMLSRAFPDQPRTIRAFEDIAKDLDEAATRIAGLKGEISTAVSLAGDIPAQIAGKQNESAILTALSGVRPGAGVLEMSGSNQFAIRQVSTADGASLVTRGQLGGLSKPAVTGSRGGNAALASLLTALASMGLITDSTTA